MAFEDAKLSEFIVSLVMLAKSQLVVTLYQNQSVLLKICRQFIHIGTRNVPVPPVQIGGSWGGWGMGIPKVSSVSSSGAAATETGGSERAPST